MPVKVIIKRQFPRDRETDLIECIRSIRNLVPQKAGYISGEYLRSIDNMNEIMTISTWFSHEDWLSWYNSSERKAIQEKIDAIPGVTAEHTVYRYLKTR